VVGLGIALIQRPYIGLAFIAASLVTISTVAALGQVVTRVCPSTRI
jgi:hypothetical protein